MDVYSAHCNKLRREALFTDGLGGLAMIVGLNAGFSGEQQLQAVSVTLHGLLLT